MTAPHDGTWELDTSTARLTVVARAFGRLTTCSMDVLAAHVELSGGGTTGRLHVGVDASSFHSGNERRDAHVRSADFLDVELHPARSAPRSRTSLGSTPVSSSWSR